MLFYVCKEWNEHKSCFIMSFYVNLCIHGTLHDIVVRYYIILCHHTSCYVILCSKVLHILEYMYMMWYYVILCYFMYTFYITWHSCTIVYYAMPLYIILCHFMHKTNLHFLPIKTEHLDKKLKFLRKACCPAIRSFHHQRGQRFFWIWRFSSLPPFFLITHTHTHDNNKTTLIKLHNLMLFIIITRMREVSFYSSHRVCWTQCHSSSMFGPFHNDFLNMSNWKKKIYWLTSSKR